MKNIIILLCIIITHCIFPASIIRKSKDYVSATEPAAVTKISQEIQQSNIHKILTDYVNYLRTGKGRNIEFDHLKNEGYAQDDIDTMKSWLRTFYFETPNIFNIPHSRLPNWIEDEFDNLTDEVGSDWQRLVEDKDANHFGPIEIRKGVIDHIVQQTSKKYSYVKKTLRKDKQYAQAIADHKKLLEGLLIQQAHRYEYIENIDPQQPISPEVEFIIVRACDIDLGIHSLQPSAVIPILNTILDPQRGNPNLKIVAAFDDQDIKTLIGLKIPDSIKHLIVVGRNIVSIDYFFLSGCHKLESLNLSLLLYISSVKDTFLAHCLELNSLILCDLSQVRIIENDFIKGCEKLQNIDLSSLVNVIEIGHDFLAFNKKLQKIDLQALTNVTSIGNWFLAVCQQLKSIDLAPLSKVKTIGHGFLAECTVLEDVDLSTWTDIQKVDSSFLSRCAELNKIRISKKLYDILNYQNYDVFLKPRHMLASLFRGNFFAQFPKLKPENIFISYHAITKTVPQLQNEESSYFGIDY